MFLVTYEVEGKGKQTDGPYKTRELAQQHADDIRGFEYTSKVAIEPACKLCGKPKRSWQLFCGAKCCARWESGERPTL